MAKGQKRSNREAKKPRQSKAKLIAAVSPFAARRAPSTPLPPRKG
jgi:hypothetical protein